jgi:hypothetical protein
MPKHWFGMNQNREQNRRARKIGELHARKRARQVLHRLDAKEILLVIRLQRERGFACDNVQTLKDGHPLAERDRGARIGMCGPSTVQCELFKYWKARRNVSAAMHDLVQGQIFQRRR